MSSTEQSNGARFARSLFWDLPAAWAKKILTDDDALGNSDQGLHDSKLSKKIQQQHWQDPAVRAHYWRSLFSTVGIILLTLFLLQYLMSAYRVDKQAFLLLSYMAVIVLPFVFYFFTMRGNFVLKQASPSVRSLCTAWQGILLLLGLLQQILILPVVMLFSVYHTSLRLYTLTICARVLTLVAAASLGMALFRLIQRPSPYYFGISIQSTGILLSAYVSRQFYDTLTFPFDRSTSFLLPYALTLLLTIFYHLLYRKTVENRNVQPLSHP